MQPDYASGMIDLGKTVEIPPSPGSDSKTTESKTHYPSLYISDVPELDDLPDGEFYFIAKAQVTRHTEETPIAGMAEDEDAESEDEEESEDESTEDDSGHCSCEITVIAMKPMDGMKAKPDSGSGLSKTLNKMEKSKAKDVPATE